MLQPPLKKKQLLYLTITALLYNGHSPLPLRIVKSISRLTKCATQATSNLDIPFFRAVVTIAMRKYLIWKSIKEELQIIKRRLRKVRRTQPAAEIKISESVEVDDCRTLVGNSTSLFNTFSILPHRLLTAEKVVAQSVSSKASNSKTVAKPKFDGEESELLKKPAIEMHSEATSFQITAKIQAVQKAARRVSLIREKKN